MHILLHVCCGPCSIYPAKYLREQGHDFTGYFFNPNIHPYREFVHRLDTLKNFAQRTDMKLIIDASYPLEDFLRQALSAPDGRCRACYEIRLRQAARFAKEKKFDCFSTTLLVSPYQKHDIIIEIAEKIADEEQIPFYYADYRTGWQEGVKISREMELYRQPYCGCIFSEKDRYHKSEKENK